MNNTDLEEVELPTCALEPDCAGELSYGPDPFAFEVNNDDTPIWLCSYHYGQLADDI